jgi:glycosyltransferase domain-containing protein
MVLPLKGREDFTLRIMRFLEESQFPCKIIIADGSQSMEIKDYFSNLAKYKNIRYFYKKYPYDADYTDYYKKIVNALTMVQTPYVALLDNDCIPLIDGLLKSVEFLEKNSSYSGCRGQHIDFTLNPYEFGNKNLLNGSSLTVGSEYFDRAHTIWRSFEDENPLNRILEWSHCTHITHYNVFRTEILLDSWRFIAENECCDLFFCEIVLALNALSLGEIKVIDTPFLMRQQNSPESASKEAIRRMDILDRMFVEKWTRDINQLIEFAAKNAHLTSGCGVPEARLKIKESIKNHFADRLLMYLERRAKAKDNSVKAEKGSDSNREKYITMDASNRTQDGLESIVMFLTRKPVSEGVTCG